MMIMQKQITIQAFVRLISKCFISLFILVLLCGCKQNNDKSVDVLNVYSIQNLDNYVLYYDNDLNNSNEELPIMVNMSLCFDCSKNESITETVCQQIKKFEASIKSEIKLLLSEKFSVLENRALNENNLKLILDSESCKFYIYSNGFIKINNNNEQSILRSKSSKFNVMLTNVYNLIEQYNDYKLNLLK